MDMVIGVDGGGSQTTAVVADRQGRPLGWGRSGCGNHQGPGVVVALQHIAEAMTEALRMAGVSEDRVAWVTYGLAGADRDKDFAILRPALAELPFSRWTVVSDAWIGLRAGTSDNVGVSLVAGSGTNAVGRNQVGDEVQVGGFGYEFGDAAGGHHLAVDGFRAAVRAYQGREEATVLSELVPQFLRLKDMETVYNAFLDHGWPIPIELAEVVHQAADAGDAVAQRLLSAMGRELGLAATAVLGKLGTDANAAIPVVLVGSLLQKGKNPHLMGALKETVQGRYPAARVAPLAVPPVAGAVQMALDRVHWQPAPDWHQLFQQWEAIAWH
jgi:N-acetylglucosamine kinase-like BadF-type ATPase